MSGAVVTRSMDAKTPLDKRALLLSIVVQEEEVGIISTVTFSPSFLALLNSYRRSMMYNSLLDPSGMSSMMTEAEQDIGSGLRSILFTSKEQKKLLKMAKATKVNPFHNKEWNPIVKHVVYFLQSAKAFSPVFIGWDITSNAYLRQDGLELDVGEIEPEDAATSLIEVNLRISDKLHTVMQLKRYAETVLGNNREAE
ncbi:hypothetical protein V8B55DRAFT_1577960 [Mucor lusitanicus]|uniref:Uncharacterized protein n=1 Tax=Mucor lusitanicus CBS 277.49 TaxID=747725 RepID=A0A168LXG4_MUCCL|nr:hypothetical protein MUCCIDRAFT_163599 [Mucor lusitanicus CBS 277.49]